MNTQTGIDFTAFSSAITKYGDDVVVTTITKTDSNIDGDETLTSGSTASVRVYISRRNYKWMFDPAGQIQGGDAILLVQSKTAVAKNYTVTWSGNTYRIHNVLDREEAGGNLAYRMANLFLI